MTIFFRILFSFIIIFSFVIQSSAQTLTLKSFGSPAVNDSLIGSNAFTAGRGINIDVQNSSGISVYVYTEPDNPSLPSGNRDIYCRLYDKNMNVLIAPFRVNQNNTGDQLYPVVKINQMESTFAIAWASNHGVNGYDIYAKKLSLNMTNPADVINQSEYAVNTNYLTLGQITPKLAFDYNYNELIVAWRDNDGQDGSGTGCYARRMDYASFPNFIGSQFILNQTTTDNQVIQDIEISPVTGAFYALYGSVMGANGYDVYYRKWTRDGSGNLVAGNEIRANTTTANWQWAASFTFNKTTGFYSIGWTSDFQDGSGRGIYFRVYNQYDVAQIVETRASIPTTNNQFNIKTMWDETTGYIIHFYMYSVTGTTTPKYQIFTPAYATSGSETNAIGGTLTYNYDDVFSIAYNQNHKNLHLGYNIHHTDYSAPSKAWTRYFKYTHASVLASGCITDTDKLWVQETSYDENGNIISEGRAYLDNYGRAKQVQAKNAADNKILAVQNIYDDFGRQVVQTLPVPITNNCFTYNSAFVKDNLGNAYTQQYFGNPLDNTTAGTPGYYYSNNNSAEPYVGTTGFPYSRTIYSDTIYGGALVFAGPGDSLKYGAKHEAKIYSLSLINELDNNYLGVRKKFVPTTATTLLFKGSKQISIDQNGVETMEFTDQAGHTLATAMTGTAGTTAITISPRVYSYNLVTDICLWNTKIEASVTSNDSIEVYIAVRLDTDTGDTTYTLSYSGPASGYALLKDDNIIACGQTGSGCPTGKRIYHIRSKYNFTVNYSQVSHCHLYNQYGYTHIYGTPSYYTASANLAGKNTASFYLKKKDNWNLNLTNAYTGMTIKMTSLTTGAVVYNGLASSFNISSSSIKVPDAYRFEVTGLPPAKYNYTKNAAITYYNDLTSFSYYFYDDAGRLVATVAPKGVNPDTTVIPKYTTRYTYSTMGRKLTDNDPDTKLTTMVYRKDGRPRFIQDNKQKQTGKFSYINYDRYGRVIETGEYNPALDGGSPWTFEAQALTPANSSSALNILEDISPTGGLGSTSCTCRTNKNRLSYSLADSGIPVARTQRYLQGGVSKTYNDNAATWYSYDEQGRLEWSVKAIYNFGGAGITKTTTMDYTYDLLGNVLNVVYQKDVSGERFEHRYFYDLSQRLVQVQTKPGSQAYFQNEAKYKFYQHGPLKRTELADSLQGIDYVYTVQGWLKSINNPVIHAGVDDANDPGKDGYPTGSNKNFGRDVFGMQFQYYDGDYARTGSNVTNTTLSGTYKNYFNGIVKATRWKVRGHGFSGDMGMYAYTYDEKYQLTGAHFGTVANASEATFTSSENFKIYDLTYDLNGNILTKKMKNESGAVSVNYTTTYDATGTTNRLVTLFNSGSFNRGYTYDSIGNVTQDQTPSGPGMQYEYDVYGKITRAYQTYSGALTKAEYYYDESGRMLRKVIYNITPPSTSTYAYTTWYVRDVNGNVMSVYDDNGSALTQRELYVYGNDRFGLALKAGSTYTYSYELTDQLGNVRATIARTRTGADATILSWADYYADGQKMPTRSGVSSPAYRYGYQGQYAENDEATGYLDFELRNFDLATSRFMQPDPMKQDWSPYAGMGNNPVSMVDPTGGKWKPKTIAGKILKGAVIVVAVAVVVAAVVYAPYAAGVLVAGPCVGAGSIAGGIGIVAGAGAGVAVGTTASGGGGSAQYTATNNQQAAANAAGAANAAAAANAANIAAGQAAGQAAAQAGAQAAAANAAAANAANAAAGANTNVGNQNGGGYQNGGDNGGMFDFRGSTNWLASLGIPDFNTNKLKYHSSTVWVYDGQFKTRDGNFPLLAGQHVRVEITNMNILGVQLELQDQTFMTKEKTIFGERSVYNGDKYTFNLLPGQTKSFDFYRFDYAPMPWEFSLNTAAWNEVANVRINIYSEWIPGDPVDPNHPKYKK